MKRKPTFREKTEQEGREPIGGRQNTLWEDQIADKCKHEWQPVAMFIPPSRIYPDLNNQRVYCVCMKCCGHTYIETAWVGYYLTSPDNLEDELAEELDKKAS